MAKIRLQVLFFLATSMSFFASRSPFLLFSVAVISEDRSLGIQQEPPFDNPRTALPETNNNDFEQWIKRFDNIVSVINADAKKLFEDTRLSFPSGLTEEQKKELVQKMDVALKNFQNLVPKNLENEEQKKKFKEVWEKLWEKIWNRLTDKAKYYLTKDVNKVELIIPEREISPNEFKIELKYDGEYIYRAGVADKEVKEPNYHMVSHQESVEEIHH